MESEGSHDWEERREGKLRSAYKINKKMLFKIE